MSVYLKTINKVELKKFLKNNNIDVFIYRIENSFSANKNTFSKDVVTESGSRWIEFCFW